MKIAAMVGSLLVFVLLLSAGCNRDMETSTFSLPAPVPDKSIKTVSDQPARDGKVIFSTCNACHNAELDPPLAPPMFGVQKRYKKAFPDRQEFVQRMVDFVQNPTMDKVIMKRPAMKLGLMPAQKLPEAELQQVAAYIYDETFAPPCKHWEIVVRQAEAAGKVDGHIQKDKMMLQRFCSG